jgi:hypothetical protein
MKIVCVEYKNVSIEMSSFDENVAEVLEAILL